MHKITEENFYHMALAIPQFALITCGEVMFSITGLSFAFSQVILNYNFFYTYIKWIDICFQLKAPISMRAIMQSAWTVTTGLGNNLDLIVVLALDGVFDSKVSFLFQISVFDDIM